MSFIDTILDRAPAPLSAFVRRHHELLKFGIVGATTMVFDAAIYYTLDWTVLGQKPAVAKVISGFLAMCLSYLLNSRWAFKARGGRKTHHEVLLFFVISGIGVLIAALPIWIANNFSDIRNTGSSKTSTVHIDFILNYVIGNILQFAFRFWALRKFAFPEDQTVLEADAETSGQLQPDCSDSECK